MRNYLVNAMLVLFVAMALGLAGCGGGGGGGSDASSTGSSPAQFAGSYNGTYSGGDTGTWSVTVDNSGNISGTTHSNYSGSNYAISGTVNSSGSASMTAGTVSDGATFSGTIDGTGKLSGSWNNSRLGANGTFTGQRDGGGTPPSTNLTKMAGHWVSPGNTASNTMYYMDITIAANGAVSGYWQYYTYDGDYMGFPLYQRYESTTKHDYNGSINSAGTIFTNTGGTLYDVALNSNSEIKFTRQGTTTYSLANKQ